MSTVIQQRAATAFVNFGLLAFFALAAATWLPWTGAGERRAQFALLAYAAVVLSFMGGIHWGLVQGNRPLTKPQTRRALGGGILALALGWLAAMFWLLGFAPWLVFAILAADFAFVRLLDGALRTHYSDLPEWPGALQRRLSVGAMLALLIAASAALT